MTNEPFKATMQKVDRADSQTCPEVHSQMCVLLLLKDNLLIISKVFVSSSTQTVEQAIDKSTRPTFLHMENYWQGNVRYVRSAFSFYVLYSICVNLVRFEKQFLLVLLCFYFFFFFFS